MVMKKLNDSYRVMNFEAHFKTTFSILYGSSLMTTIFFLINFNLNYLFAHLKR